MPAELLSQTQGAPGLEYGALGLVAIVVLYVTASLVKWMTNTLNGKLDRIAAAMEQNAKATESNTSAIREQAGATKELTRRVEGIDGRISR